jgi:hypothetical protein
MSTTRYIAYVEGPERSYVRRNPDASAPDADYPASAARGIEYTEDLAAARRFASQAAITTFLAGRPTAVPVLGGTGTTALTVVEP